MGKLMCEHNCILDSCSICDSNETESAEQPSQESLGTCLGAWHPAEPHHKEANCFRWTPIVEQPQTPQRPHENTVTLYPWIAYANALEAKLAALTSPPDKSNG